MPFITVEDGHRIFFEERGSGPVIVFIPGFFGIADVFHHIIGPLSRSHRCISLDLRGYGRSSSIDPRATYYSVNTHASDVRSVLDAAKFGGPVLVVTHSFGGLIAVQFHDAHPTLVAGIVFSGTPTDGRQMSTLGLDPNTLSAAVSDPADAVEFYKGIGLQDDKLWYEPSKWNRQSLRANALCFTNVIFEEEYYTNIQVPTLSVYGEDDVATPVTPCATEIQRLIPDNRLEVLGAVGHFGPVEAATKFVDLTCQLSGRVFELSSSEQKDKGGGDTCSDIV